MIKKFVQENKNKILIILGILIITIVLLLFSNKVNIEKYIIKKGFKKYDSSMYYKQLSKLSKEEFENNKNGNNDISYDYLYFQLGTNHTSEEVGIYKKNVNLEYIGEYSFKSNNILYSIRGEYGSTIIQLTGKYDINNEEFTCSPIMHHNITYNDELKSSICNLTKNYSINLYNNSVNMINDEKIIKKIINNSET